MRAHFHLTRGRLIAFCLLLPALALWRVVFTGAVLLPIPLLRQVAPWGTPLPRASWNPLMWDALAFFLPMRGAAAQAIHGGHLPLWNPAILGGTPLLADVQSAVLYPFNALFWLLPVERAFGASAALHLALAMLFTVFWLRQEGISRTGALLGAITFAFGGWSLAWLELPNFLATAVWTPLLLGLLASPPRRSFGLTAAGCAVAVAMTLTAGHLQIAFYCLFGVGLHTLVRVLLERRWLRLGPLLLGALLGGLLAAPQLLPTAALSKVSHRSTTATAEGYAAFTRMGLPPTPQGEALRPALAAELLSGFFTPDMFGNPSKGFGGRYYGLAPYSEVSAYVGWLPLLLALHALFFLRRRPGASALAAVGAVGLLLALGTPLNAPLYFGVPGFARFGTPSRALVLVAVALSGLAGFGWDRLMDAMREADRSVRLAPEWGRTLAVGTVLLLVVMGSALLLYPAPPAQLLEATGYKALARFLVFGPFFAMLFLRPLGRWPATPFLLLLVTGADLLSFGQGYNLTGPTRDLAMPPAFVQAVDRAVGTGRLWVVVPEWPLDRAPRAVLPPNLAMRGGWPEVGGYEGAYLRATKERINAWQGHDASPPTNGNMVTPTALASPLMREMAVSAVLTPAPLPEELAKAVGLNRTSEGAGWVLYAVLAPKPRAAFHALWPPPPGARGKPLAFRESPSNPNVVTILTAEPVAGLVLLRDANADGWEASVDGVPTPPLPQTAALGRAVRVKPGHHTVTWEYCPRELAQGWRWAGAGAVGLLALLLSAGASARRRTEGPTDADAAAATETDGSAHRVW